MPTYKSEDYILYAVSYQHFTNLIENYFSRLPKAITP